MILNTYYIIILQISVILDPREYSCVARQACLSKTPNTNTPYHQIPTSKIL